MIRVHGFLGGISEALRADLATADLVVGGRRQLDDAGVPAAQRVELGSLAPAIERLKALDDDKLAVVIASGDPGFFGILRPLRRAGLHCEVVPTITSLQAAFAAVALPWDDAQLVSAHSGGIETAIRIAGVHPKVGVLTAPGKGLAQLVAALRGRDKHFVVAERLGEADERVRVFDEAAALAVDEADLASPYVVLILDAVPESAQAVGHSPQLAGDPNAPGPDDPKPASDTRADGSDRAPIIGQVVNTTRARHQADQIDQALGVESKRYDGPASAGLVAAWGECDLIVSHLALGATTRLIAPLLADKHTDPGVVVVDEAGHFAVPLVGGHIGGANELARRIGEALDATAVVSTATDSLGIPALDQLGWAVSGDVAGVTAAIIDGAPVSVLREHLWPMPPLPGNVLVPAPGEPAAPGTVGRVVVTDRAAPTAGGASDDQLPTVVLHPDSLVVGMGCNKGTSVEALRELLDATLAGAGLAKESIAALVSVDAKAGELGLIKLADELGVPYVTYPADRLAEQDAPNPSAVVEREIGSGSVSEASVLARGAELIVEKHKSAEATCAIGRIPARGRLHVVGLGPGSRDLLTPRAANVVRHANLVVGYGPYVRQVRDLVSPHAEVMATKMGTEEQRTRAAIDAARSGLDVAFLSGGDPAIYAMASPTLEMGTDGVDVDIVPGVTAELAASAILGAPLGHDHATISLSDLHTDWELILKRVRAAAQGDFVITLYNPRSRSRIHQLPDALAIIAEYRGPDTPVASVSQAERAQQHVHMSSLADFQPEWVDMNTIVIVGSDTTTFATSGDGRRIIVTPRDYHWMDGAVSGHKRLNYPHGSRPRVSRAEFKGQAAPPAEAAQPPTTQSQVTPSQATQSRTTAAQPGSDVPIQENSHD
ncbi:precorrin-3B C(17)-methyltransferase [Propionibacterium freudenreichii]|uniref:precorrin-3B C(17)-methyltransferase n=1 Tax=Propionibacterium freudenreichii TaxID=1744 RepID=UPI000543B5C6|nr:precorrin-3B C(17)-methyltransferase [Propionibacterium freudenreichii]CEG98155.1 precorrin methylase (precorrin-3B C17-methyltransferase) CbiE/G/H fusion protein [Propionibacterium freudenreichii]